MRQMSGKKRVVMTGISSLLVAGLVVGNIEYATHTYRYDSKVQAMAANNKVVEQTASFASSKKKSTVSKEETVYATLDANGGVTDVIVSDWLKNSGQVDSVKDSSTLKDITNTRVMRSLHRVVTALHGTLQKATFIIREQQKKASFRLVCRSRTNWMVRKYLQKISLARAVS